ncbi:MAG: MerR family transcriptional regulator [Candidatus Cloacimonetes bacterium]|nr:MerR family transcriptional regulator [Candidatus Cloacimonadota bacterium]
MIKEIQSKTKYYYTMSEVCNITSLKPHVLRFWETQFPQLHPKRRKSSNRRYTSKDIETIKKIKYLLYVKGFTIKGAKKSLGRITDFAEIEKKDAYQFDEEKMKTLKNIQNQLKELKKITEKLKENKK